LDEVVYGIAEAAWPLIRSDLHLSYAQVGILLTVPGLLGSVLQPLIGVLGDSGRRRVVFLVGGIGFAVTLGLFAAATTFSIALVALVLGAMAWGGFVGLTEATLMDQAPGSYERSMARWTVVGGVGAVAGPLVLAGFAAAGFGWRWALMAMAVVTLPLVWSARTIRFDPEGPASPIHEVARRARRALRTKRVLRWLLLLQVSNLLDDTLTSYLALYTVDVAGASPVQGGLAVAVWTAAFLIGNAVLVPMLKRMDADRYLRLSAAAAMVLYPAFLLLPGVGMKLVALGALGVVRAGWYAVLKARVFGELEGSSGTAVGLADLAEIPGQLFPIVIGVMAARFGLGTAMWILLIAPVAMSVAVPRALGARRS
jgi:FSR family fosmidomycin resistance protein-like MFS transporter